MRGTKWLLAMAVVVPLLVPASALSHPPGLTATNIPRQVAQTLSCAISSPSTVARSSVDSTTRATSLTGRSLGVGRKSLIEYSAVTVHGGLSAPVFCIRRHAADQLQ